jgi:hypothetical protein
VLVVADGQRQAVHLGVFGEAADEQLLQNHHRGHVVADHVLEEGTVELVARQVGEVGIIGS